MTTPTSAATNPLFRAATLLTLLSVIMGSLVCATESGLACPTWPGCYPGQLVPGLHLPPWIEFAQRLISGACLIVLVMAGMSVWRRKDDPWLRWLPWVAVVGALAAAIFGMSVIFWGIGPWLGALDLVCSLIALLAITLATVAIERGSFSWTRTPTTLIGTLAVIDLIVLHALGILVAGPQSFTRCMGWPLPGLMHYDGSEALQIVRLALAGLAALLIVGLVVVSRGRSVLPWVAFALVVAELALGFYLAQTGLHTGAKAAYSALAVLTLWVTALATARSGVRRLRPEPAGNLAT